MSEDAGMSRRAAMFGAAVIATAMVGVTPVGSAYTVDTTGDGIPDAIEFGGAENKHAHSLARSMASRHGGDWAVNFDEKNQFVMIFRRPSSAA